MTLAPGPQSLKGPVSVDALNEAAERVAVAVDPFPTLVLAIANTDAASLYGDMTRSMSWPNFLHVYRETLRYVFVDDQKQTPVWTDEE